ncbi:MAG TPA: metallophosphoesterase [Vicinamibacterales bacterium]|jgi:predicted MPP superfamily phosphohydrolase|nr:metallophosphoesterase [Vicinamibacterales bacterium]
MGLSRRAALKGVLATAVGAATGAGIYGVGYERHHLGITEADLPVSGLPPSLDGLRIGFLTDIHHSRMVPADDVAQAVALTLSMTTDLIVLGGDYVTWGERGYVGPVAELLKPLHAPNGVFAILGNHDDDRDMPAALARNGFTVLKDQTTRLSVRGETINLIGIRFWTRKASEIVRLVRRSSEAAILLAHDPRRLTEAAALDIPAVLSGHTHGGQVVIPGIGAIARRNFPVVAGLGSRDNSSIFVSRGVGTVYVPVRINCPPEVAVVTLRRRSQI